jgi:hypothetical protein
MTFKENKMKPICVAISVAALCLGLSSKSGAQMGMNLFQKPAIAKFINPVVGKGAQYETIRTNSNREKVRTMEMGVVAKESIDGKEGFWMQMVTTDNKGEPMLAKTLVSREDFQFHKMIIQMNGQAMEMPFNPNANRESKIEESMKEWRLVGTESITVPAGTFVCEHWRNDKKESDLWASDKITPFGMVKQVGKTETMVLTKVLTDVPDRITGPVSKFDPQLMMQQMQRERPQQP